MWRKGNFIDALGELLSEFGKQPSVQSLALVWRTPDEYSVMDSWLLKRILVEMDVKTLRVIMWLNRKEAAALISAVHGGELWQ